MEKDPDVLRKIGDTLADNWGKALGLGVGFVAVGAAVKHHHFEKAKRLEAYAESLAILEDPNMWGMFLPQQREAALKDINTVAAVLLVNESLTWQSWKAQSGLYERRFRLLQRLLQKRELVAQTAPATFRNRPYEPQLPLVTASKHPNEYPRLAQALAPLAGANTGE